TPVPAEATTRPSRSKHAVTLVLRYIPAGQVTPEQLTRFGKLAGLNAREIASLPEHARNSGITVLQEEPAPARPEPATTPDKEPDPVPARPRSEEHTSELQSRENLVCRLLLEKKRHRRGLGLT